MFPTEKAVKQFETPKKNNCLVFVNSELSTARLTIIVDTLLTTKHCYSK